MIFPWHGQADAEDIAVSLSRGQELAEKSKAEKSGPVFRG
jgi:hypothetical protein